MSFNDAVKEAGVIQADVDIVDELVEPEGVTFRTIAHRDDMDAVMDLVAYINQSLEEMDWLSLPLQGRIKEEDVVITVRKKVENEAEIEEAFDKITEEHLESRLEVQRERTKLASSNLTKVVDNLEKAQRGLEVLDRIMSPEEDGFEEFQDGMDALGEIIKHYSHTTQVDPATGNYMRPLMLTEKQSRDLERIMENEHRIQEEESDFRSPMVSLFHGKHGA